MSGILHVFRTQPDVYQVNYTLGVYSWVRTMPREELEHLLVTPVALEEDFLDKVLDELNAKENITIADVSITENEASALGFEPMPSDA
ncbi:hypothetical protein Acid345_0554 [Candidatus Koribacter versatilis Ellin345]|uniref:Uncharacterized protein n=1 Tax=Koribacter versatilis (strain Ellin345) TaxID=204669 RepID=Q1IU91_KORVE|nr:hypothetical protein [Candidatus Koribacter versatilis]ABF39559.1 hypothetical protein Acid345_0554 [Candidatus Koribacter versatilis Ellin345]